MLGAPAARSRVDRAVQQVAQGATDQILLGGRIIRIGSGDPNGVVAGNPGDIYINEDGGDGTTLYVAESAGTDWRAMPGSEVLGALMTLDQGAIVADVPVEQVTSTWNNAAVPFRGRVMRFIETARAVASSYFSVLAGPAGDEEKLSHTPNSLRLTAFDLAAFIEARCIGTAAGIGPNQRMRRLRGTTAAPTPALSGDELGATSYHGTTGGSLTRTAVVATEDHTGAGRGTKFTVSTVKNGGNVAHESMRVTTEAIGAGAGTFFEGSTTAGITASVVQAQGQGALTSEINEVAVCANANDTVTLPAAVTGRRATVINNGAQVLQIFPAAGDDLGAGVDVAATLAAGAVRTYAAYDATNWRA